MYPLTKQKSGSAGGELCNCRTLSTLLYSYNYLTTQAKLAAVSISKLFAFQHCSARIRAVLISL